MPTQPYTAGELADTRLLLEVAEALVQDGDESDEEVADMLVLAAVEPLQRSHLQDIGPEKLSVRRLQREANSESRSICPDREHVWPMHAHNTPGC